jgi:hypothetical protein
MIPKVVHFIFGLNKDFGGKPFHLIHKIAIQSAYEIIKPDKIFLYYAYEPQNNKYWEGIKKYVELVKIEPIDKIFENEIDHCAHKACITRLQVLNEIGGIYLDCDSICINSFDELLKNKFVMAKQDDYGLCNAIMLAEKKSEFGKIWFDNYKTFDKNKWDYHAVVLPKILAEQNKNLITVLESRAFFQPSFLFTDEIFIKFNNKTNDYAMHLWENMCWDLHIKNINEEYILNSNSTYAYYAKQFI